jgi:hypothetical protein
MDGKFYNKMPFTVNFRKTWIPGNPAAAIEPGHIIEGPVEVLSQYHFFAALPFPFHTVDSVTQENRFQVTDNTHVTEPKIVTTEPVVVRAGEQDISKLPFDPKNVNWLSVKLADLETACGILNIDISQLAALKPKTKKWELVKLVKKALGLEVK